MKRFPYFLIFFLFGAFWQSTSYGQSEDPETALENESYIKQQVNKIVPPSPNASSLGIYGNVPVGHYTGVPNISIPIYEIPTGDFTLPITLSYHASGIKVGQEASSVGLGWVLNAGGCIVREIKHWDDFFNGYYHDEYFPTCDSNNNYIDSERDRYLAYLDNSKDSEPDIFSYNFGNMSGSFFFEQYKNSQTNSRNRGEAIISNKNTYLKIICNLFYEDGYGYATNFEITDAYGNTYLFGSSSASRENTRTFVGTLPGAPAAGEIERSNQDIEGRDKEPDAITAWYLDKIITAKRDTIKFEYEKERIYTPIRVSEDVSYCVKLQPYGSFGDPLPKMAYKYYGLSYTVNEQLLLKTISFNGGEINITYDDREDIEYADSNKKTRKVASLVVTNKSNNDVARVQFNHSYLGNVGDNETENALNCRLLLDAISIYRGGVYEDYTFYYNRNPLPRKNSSETDYWGSYNDGPEPTLNPNQKFYYTPPIRVQQDGEYKLYTGINKNPSTVRSQYGILTSIKYPTGGRTNFEYELNDFSNDFFDSVDTLVRRGGGLRIKNIYDLSSTTDTTAVRSFTYKRNGISSGILMTTPVYHFDFDVTRATATNPMFSASYINGNSSPYTPLMGSASGMHVGYSYVEEKNITHGVNNGYVAYRFNNRANQTVDLEGRCIRNYPSIPHMDNGLPTEILYCDSSGRGVKRTEFYYRQVEKSSIKGLMCYQIPITKLVTFDAKFYDVYSERWVLDNKIETLYFPDNKNMTIFSYYDYDSTNWLKKYEKITTLKGTQRDSIETFIKYPLDYGSQHWGLQNKIGIPIEITRKKNNRVISANTMTFGSFNGLYLPNAYLEWDTRLERYYTQFTIEKYDSRANILQLSGKDHVPTTYLWSYNSEYPVAEIKNATYSQVETALGASAITAINNYDGRISASAPDFQSYGAILRSKLPDALVSIYTYKPLVGGTGITDPAGRTIRYGYNGSRLAEIRDDKGPNGNLIQNFEYKITNNDNSIRTRTYTAENNSAYIADITYYDGLGYLSQSVSIDSSPMMSNIVTPVYYDALRRESRQYLPYAVSDNAASYRPAALSEQVAYYNNKYGSNAGGYSYSESEYEASPLNRVKASYNVGSDFREDGKKSSFDYSSNADNEVVMLKVSSQTLQAAGFYTANTLFKNTVTNEDGASAVTYKDFLDRVILERTIDSTDNNATYDTYYVYDDAGNLCYVLPPKLSQAAASWPSGSVSDEAIKDLAYIYKYDGRNRCVEKRLPGADPIFMVYDQGDRLVMSHDGNMRQKNQWSYTQYDALGRPVCQSVLVSPEALASSTLQEDFDMSTADKPYNPLNSGFTTDAILTETAYDAYVYEAEGNNGVSLDQIPVGTNIRGWTFKMTLTDLRLILPADAMYSMCLNGKEWMSLVYYTGDPLEIRCDTSISATKENVGWVYEGDWTVSDGYTFTIKDDQDYIVTSNNLPSHSEMGLAWGFDYIIGKRSVPGY